jgi:hypothetical protein
MEDSLVITDKTQLTDSIYISGDYAIIGHYNWHNLLKYKD